MKVSKGKQATLMPTRDAMQSLGSSQRTLADYSKITPLSKIAATPSILRTTLKPKTPNAG